MIRQALYKLSHSAIPHTLTDRVIRITAHRNHHVKVTPVAAGFSGNKPVKPSVPYQRVLISAQMILN